MPVTQHFKTDGPGVVLQRFNDTGFHLDVIYASVTAPKLCYVEVKIGDAVHDGVWVGPGASHSWWAPAGGKLLDHNGLDPGQTLTITASGECAMRIDWT